jgi:glycogen(starch) synthase
VTTDTLVRPASEPTQSPPIQPERAIRVLLLGPCPPPWGGVQTNLVALRDFLRQRGVTCAVINLTCHQRADGDDVYYPRSRMAVLRLLLRLRYDVLHIHIGGNLSTRLLLLGLVCSALPWAKVVLTFHSGGYPRSAAGRKAGPRTLGGFVLRRFDRHIAVNQELVDFFHRVGCEAERVQLIPPYAVPGGTLAELSRAELPATVEQFVVAHQPLLVSVSGLEPEYDIPLQLEALGRLHARYPRAGLLVVGSGGLAKELSARSSSLPYREHILLAGDLPHAATLAVVTRSDVFLRTTHYDGDAISVREALWLGTPVIATDNGMRPAGVRLVPIGDAAALTDAIGSELAGRRDPGARPAVAVDPEATGEANLGATLALYREVLA